MTAAGICFFLGKVWGQNQIPLGGQGDCFLHETHSFSPVLQLDCAVFRASDCTDFYALPLLQFIFAEVVNSMLKKNTTFKNIKAQSGKSGFTLVLGLRLSPVPSYLCSYGASVRLSFKWCLKRADADQSAQPDGSVATAAVRGVADCSRNALLRFTLRWRPIGLPSTLWRLQTR